MDRKDVVLAALAVSGGQVHSPVQVQKLFFLIDERIPTHIGGKKFNFTPFDYGPFDADVYRELESLAERGLVQINQQPKLGYATYQPTPLGLASGQEALAKLRPDVAAWLRETSAWVLKLSFAELVSSIYRAFPEMKVNSVFRH